MGLLRSSRLRLLPLTIAVMGVMFVAKCVDIVDNGNKFSQLFLARPALAENVPEQDTDNTATIDDEESGDDDMATLETPAVEERSLTPPRLQFSDTEVSILESLAERREELDILEEEIRLKESLLEAAELRLDGKIRQITELEGTVRDLLETYDEKEDAQIRSLVKIYENMKPKEAARIFDELELPILLRVVDRMSERRVAPILAKMSPQKAMALTVDLAENQKLRAQKEAELNNIANQ